MKQNKYKIQKNTCVQLKTTEINRHITKLGIYIYIYMIIHQEMHKIYTCKVYIMYKKGITVPTYSTPT